MMEHFLLAGMSGLLAYENKEDDKFLFWLWIANCGMWSINFISDIVRLVMP